MLVNAAGAWADDIARPRRDARRSGSPRSAARWPGSRRPRGTTRARWPMVIGAGESWYMKPDAGALLISPADDDPAEPHDAWADDMVLAEGIARWEAHVTTPVTRMIANWAGLAHLLARPQPGDRPGAGDAPDFLWCRGPGRLRLPDRARRVAACSPTSSPAARRRSTPPPLPGSTRPGSADPPRRSPASRLLWSSNTLGGQGGNAPLQNRESAAQPHIRATAPARGQSSAPRGRFGRSALISSGTTSSGSAAGAISCHCAQPSASVLQEQPATAASRPRRAARRSSRRGRR